MDLQELRAGLKWDDSSVRAIINAAIRKLVDASTTVQGLVRLATDAEAQAKAANDIALTPDNLAALGASDAFAGLAEFATDAEAVAVAATDRALTPANFAGKAGQQTYAEGTFTPALTFGGAAVGMTFGSQAGHYERVGRLVNVGIQITLTAKGSSAGAAVITGLPFTVGSGINLATIAAHAVTAGVGDTHLQATFNGAATTIALSDIGSGNTVDLTDVDFTNTSRIRISGVYRV